MRTLGYVLLLLAIALPRPARAAPEDLAEEELDGPGELAGEWTAPTPDLVETGPSPMAVTGPPIGEVLAAADAAAGLDRDPTAGWRRRARAAGLIPWVTVRGGWDASWKEAVPDVGRRRTFEVRATWRLDRLLFDPRELQATTIAAVRRRERQRLATHVIRLYFGWRRATAAALRDSRWSTRAEQLAAELDVVTDGWFSEWLAGTRRGASGARTR